MTSLTAGEGRPAGASSRHGSASRAYCRRMHISERWEYLTIVDIPEAQFEGVKESYAGLGYESVAQDGDRLVVRKEFPVTGQMTID
jgi:hypothetical protein